MFKKETTLHMIRIRFGTFSIDRITKSLKANLEYKLSHFGGTAGLFNGFSIISVFEVLTFGVSMGIFICKFSVKKVYRSNIIKVQEYQPKKKNYGNNISNLKQKIEAMERELMAYGNQMVERNLRIEVLNKKMNKWLRNKQQLIKVILNCETCYKGIDKKSILSSF